MEYNIAERLNGIITKSNYYKIISDTLKKKNIIITPSTSLNQFIPLINFENTYEDVDYVLRIHKINYVIKNFTTTLKNGMLCVDFLQQLYKEYLVYIALTMHNKQHLNVCKEEIGFNKWREYFNFNDEVGKTIYYMVENLIYCKFNFPEKNISFEEKFLIKLDHEYDKNKVREIGDLYRAIRLIKDNKFMSQDFYDSYVDSLN